jgi:holo-[acyl-carrier protein] synthase
MILGIGADIVDVERIKSAVAKPDVRDKTFTEKEIAYCEKNKSGESFAARAAAKEAFFKALGTGWTGEMKITEVEILNDEAGAPAIHLSGNVLEVFKSKGGGAIHVSLSHLKDKAIAFVVIEKKSNR